MGSEIPSQFRPLLLVVDDEPLLCDLYVDILSPDYEIEVFSDGWAALSRALVAPALRGVVTDVSMPGLNGVRLAREVLAQRPGARVLLVSGTAVRAAVLEGLPPDRVAFIQKPFDGPVLRESAWRLFGR